MGLTKAGAVKIAAKRIGVPLKVYLSELAAGRKWCTKCKKWVDVADFGRDRSRPDGLQAVCKPCRKRPSQKQ